jgi:hypothetical protein
MKAETFANRNRKIKTKQNTMSKREKARGPSGAKNGRQYEKSEQVETKQERKA